MKLKTNILLLIIMMFGLTACVEVPEEPIKEKEAETQEQVTVEPEEEVVVLPEETDTVPEEAEEQPKAELFEGYKHIQVDGGDFSGNREANVVVNIGFGEREYWAFTNEHGQLVRVIAKEIVLQDDASEPVLSTGRYYSDAARVPGVESSSLDKGHVIADSLGGVANAYNITPQDSTLNRHGDQAYMERGIREAGGATDFEAIITYASIDTQIPSKYKFTYTLRGNVIVDEFDNVDPDEINAAQGLTTDKVQEKAPNPDNDLASVDTNGDGKVTIKEAKAAGHKMPIMSDHWLYQYMDDRNNNGMVGE